jgi:WD40 repeat protein
VDDSWPRSLALLLAPHFSKDRPRPLTCPRPSANPLIPTSDPNRFDEQAQYAFVGDINGEISMIKLNEQTCTKVTSLKGHSAAIRCLVWANRHQMLYSASNDKVIICWDIGGKRGTAFELQGHSGRVSSVAFSSQPQMLLSAGEDRMVISWKLRVQRKEVRPTLRSSTFELVCSQLSPFFEIDSDSDLAGKRSLSTMFVSILLEHQSDGGSKDDWIATTSLSQMWQRCL